MSPRSNPPLQTRRRWEALIRRFEEAWLRGERPAIEDHLPAEGAERGAVLIELVHAELELRLRAGEPARVEDYLGRYPDLAGDAGVVVGLIAAEYQLRRAQDSGICPTEYQRRFPDYRLEGVNLPLAAGEPDTANPPSSKKIAGVGERDAPTQPPRERAGQGTAPLAAACGRYRPMRFHARGGLGEVFVAEDGELNRQVALKRIQEQFADDPEARNRFLLEAEITARLEHPGVVPVHGMVQGPDGKPCYTMRFIEGPTLALAIKEFHEANKQPGRAPGERRLALRHLLSQFIAICNAVAYTHSRGVLPAT
jgi:hypothetical protein